MMKKVLAASLVASMVLGATGISAMAESVEGMTVAFIPKVTGNAFFESANDGAQEFAEKWGINVEYMGNLSSGMLIVTLDRKTSFASAMVAFCPTEPKL